MNVRQHVPHQNPGFGTELKSVERLAGFELEEGVAELLPSLSFFFFFFNRNRGLGLDLSRDQAHQSLAKAYEARIEVGRERRGP